MDTTTILMWKLFYGCMLMSKLIKLYSLNACSFILSVIPNLKGGKKGKERKEKSSKIITLSFELYSKPLLWPTGSVSSGPCLPLSPYPTHSFLSPPLSCCILNGLPSPSSKPFHTPKLFICFFLLAGSQLKRSPYLSLLRQVFWMAWTKEVPLHTVPLCYIGFTSLITFITSSFY